MTMDLKKSLFGRGNIIVMVILPMYLYKIFMYFMLYNNLFKNSILIL